MLRRPALPTAVTVLAVVLALAACGSSEPGPGSDATAEDGGAFPVTIDHVLGSTTIERPPSAWSRSA